MASDVDDLEPERARLWAGLVNYVLFRSLQWAHFLLLPLVGLEPWGSWSDQALPIGRGVAIAFLVLSFGYLLNGFSDRRLDRSSSKALVAQRARDRRLVIATVVLLPTLAIALASTGPPVVWLATALCCLSGLLYSVGPRLKAYPGICTLMNVTNFMPLMLVGFDRLSAVGRNYPLLLAFAVLLLENQLLHEAADQHEDESGGIRTTFLWLGRRRSAAVCAGLGLLLTAVVHQAPMPGALPLAGACLLAFAVAIPVIMAGHGDNPHAMGRLRIVHRWLSVGAGSAIYLLLKFFVQ